MLLVILLHFEFFNLFIINFFYAFFTYMKVCGFICINLILVLVWLLKCFGLSIGDIARLLYVGELGRKKDAFVLGWRKNVLCVEKYTVFCLDYTFVETFFCDLFIRYCFAQIFPSLNVTKCRLKSIRHYRMCRAFSFSFISSHL